MLDGDYIIGRRGLEQRWGVKQVLMGYAANISSARSRFEEWFYHATPIIIKIG